MKSGVVPAHVVGSEDRCRRATCPTRRRHAGVQQRVVGQVAVGPDPQPLVGLARLPGGARGARRCGAGRSGGAGRTSRPARPSRAASRSESGGRSRAAARRASGTGARGPPRGRGTRPHVEDGPAVLDGDDPPGGERAAVADAVHLVEDRDRRVAGAQEVRVQRVHPAVLDGAPGRHEGLPGHLAAEDALALLVGLGAAEDVDLDGLEVEQVDEELQRRAHGAHVRRRGRSAHGHVATAPLPCAGMAPAATAGDGASSRSPTGSPGAWPRRPTRSRAATSTTTGGRGSTTPSRARSSRAATPATRSTAGARTSSSWPTWGSAPTASRSSGAASSRPRASSRWPRSSTTGASAPPATGTGSSRSSPSTTSPRRCGWPPGAAGRRPTPPTASPASWPGPRRTWATSSGGPAPSTSPTSWR